MAWRRPGDKPLSERMMVNLLTHICVTQPRWVKHVSYVIICNIDNPLKTPTRKYTGEVILYTFLLSFYVYTYKTAQVKTNPWIFIHRKFWKTVMIFHFFPNIVNIKLIKISFQSLARSVISSPSVVKLNFWGAHILTVIFRQQRAPATCTNTYSVGFDCLAGKLRCCHWALFLWQSQVPNCGMLYQKRVSRAMISNYIRQYLRDEITCPCPWYLLPTQRY